MAKRRLEDQAHRDIAQAWWVVRIWILSQKGKGKVQLPALQSLIRSPRRRSAQSPDQMVAALEMLSARYGGKVRRVH